MNRPAPRPASTSCCVTDLSASRQRAADTLRTLIRKFATETLLEEIADGDSQAMPDDVPKHLAALHDLRDTYDWSLARQPNNHWHPSEPIELISYAVDDHSYNAQVFCNPLLLLAQLEGSDQADMHYRWFKSPGETWFRALMPPWHDAMLAGFSALHVETSELERGFWATPDANGKWLGTEDGSNG